MPRNLSEAIQAFADDLLSAAVMGPLIYQTYIDFNMQEWDHYHCHISDWKIQRYLQFF